MGNTEGCHKRLVRSCQLVKRGKGRASGGFEAEEQCREVSVDPRVGSPRREGRLGFGELSSR